MDYIKFLESKVGSFLSKSRYVRYLILRLHSRHAKKFIDSLENKIYEISIYDILLEMGNGIFNCGLLKGWISVEYRHAGSVYEVLWCTGENSHDPLSGPAVSIQIGEGDKADNIFKSALSMHPVTDQKEIEYFKSFMAKKIKSAYLRNKAGFGWRFQR